MAEGNHRAKGEAVSQSVSGFVRGYFRRTRREKIAQLIERVGEWFIRVSVRIKNPSCRCNICTRNLNGILDQWADDEMNLWWERDQPWTDGTCIGESK